jgi:hypothetical protein
MKSAYTKGTADHYSTTERDRMGELMKQHRLEGSEDQRCWNAINANFSALDVSLTMLLSF